MFVTLGIPYAMRMRHIVFCGLLHDIFPHYLTKGMILEKIIEYKM
jgi:hypothetical protein